MSIAPPSSGALSAKRVRTRASPWHPQPDGRGGKTKVALLVWCSFPRRSYFCCGYEAKSLLNPFPGEGCGMEFVPKFRVLIRTRSARFCQKYFGMGYAQNPTPSSLPLSWPLYKVNVVPAGTPLPLHIRAEGGELPPTPAPQLGSLPTLWPLWPWGKGPGQCGDVPRSSFRNSKGAWHRIQDTRDIRQSLCLEEKK